MARVDEPNTRKIASQAGLPVAESAVFQIGRGDATYDTVQLFGENLVIVRVGVAPKIGGYIVPDKDWYVVMFPISWRNDYFFNGHSADPGDAFFVEGNNGYSTVGSERDTIAVGVRKRVLHQTCAALTGIELADFHFFDRVFSTSTSSGSRLLNRLQRLTVSRNLSQISQDRYKLDAFAECDVIADLAMSLTPFLTQRDIPTFKGLNAIQVVRRAEASVRNHPQHCPSLADLCAATGVGKVWLHKCFDEIYGLSPMQCIRLFRLSKAREALLHPTRYPVMVKDAALQYGFANSGRFAKEYQFLFGEYPMQTVVNLALGGSK